MDRYLARESIVPIRQPRLEQPLAGLGQGLEEVGKVFGAIAEADQQAYMAERGAAAQGALLDLNRELEEEIAQGTLLDFDSLETELATRAEERLAELNLSPSVRRRYEPQLTYLKAQFDAGLKTKIAKRRLEVEAAGINETLLKFQQSAIDAQFDQEVLNYKGLMESAIDDLPDALFPAYRKAVLKQNTWDGVVQQRTLRALDDPEIDPRIVQTQVEAAKATLSPEMYTDLAKRTRQAVEGEERDDILFSALDAIDALERDGGDMAGVRAQLENSRDILGPQLFNALREEVNRVESRKRGEDAAAVLDEVRSLSALHGNYDGATAFLNQNRDRLSEDEYRDGLYAIDSARMDMIQAQNQALRQGRVTDVKMEIDSGAWDALSLDEVSTKVNSLARVQKMIPSSSIYEIKEYWRNRQYQQLNKKMEISMAMEAVANGIKPTEEQAKLLWDMDQRSHADIRFFKDHLNKVGARRHHFDFVKERIFSNNAQQFAQGIYYGMQLFFFDNRQAKEYFDADTLKAITWGYHELRTIDEQDQEIVIDPETGEAVKQPSAFANIANAYDKIHERLFPDKGLLGISMPEVPVEQARAAADRMLGDIFYNPGTVARALPVIPMLDWAGTTLGAFIGGDTAGYRALAEYSTWSERVSPLPYEAEEYYRNLVAVKVMDQAAGGQVSPEKAAELALPEFLSSWGITRLGADPGTAYWQFMAPEIAIRKQFGQGTEEYRNVLQDFYKMVYDEAIDFTKDNPRYKELSYREFDANAGDWATMEEKKKPPRIRLLADFGTIDQEIPDYFVGYMKEDFTFTKLESGGTPMVLRGRDIAKFLADYGKKKLGEIRQ